MAAGMARTKFFDIFCKIDHIVFPPAVMADLHEAGPLRPDARDFREIRRDGH
jgi:hypothetical protein